VPGIHSQILRFGNKSKKFSKFSGTSLEDSKNFWGENKTEFCCENLGAKIGSSFVSGLKQGLDLRIKLSLFRIVFIAKARD